VDEYCAPVFQWCQQEWHLLAVDLCLGWPVSFSHPVLPYDQAQLTLPQCLILAVEPVLAVNPRPPAIEDETTDHASDSILVDR
jgi:hypothetical protein